jgi:hypothetical protein
LLQQNLCQREEYEDTSGKEVQKEDRIPAAQISGSSDERQYSTGAKPQFESNRSRDGQSANGGGGEEAQDKLAKGE